MRKLVRSLVLTLALFAHTLPVGALGGTPIIKMIDQKGVETSRLIDGNRIQLQLKMPVAVSSTAEVQFTLEGLAVPVATCSIPSGTDTCSSDPFDSTGWFWGTDGAAQPGRVIHASISGQPVPAVLEITVKPRPVVMVHGFLSSWETWKAYLGPGGYLASLGLKGFAVGDGQAPGILNTGSPSNPAAFTNSIAQNAEILKGYIAAVQKQTGAEKVDLLVHSMGGMISRYYLDRVMDNDNVAQVIFLGTPMSGSACVFPVAALGYLMPASLEILPDYMVNIFNRQIIHRHGVPFYMVAGTLLLDPLTSPCTSAPSDTVVGLDSATSIQLEGVQEAPLYHGNLTGDQKVFEEDVTHLLKNLPGSFSPRPDLKVPASVSESAQFSRAYSGHLKPGESAEVIINIDPEVSLANFTLYDSSRSLENEVRGANGKVITLDPAKNGVLKIENPETMLYLGYGFKQPKPGKWVVKLMTTSKTPSQGADYSINARFIGGATLSARNDPTISALGQAVTISASLQAAGLALKADSAEALVRKPDGQQVLITLSAQGDTYSAKYYPDLPGLHSVEVRLTGKNAGGFNIDRAAFLAFEIQPGAQQVSNSRLIALILGMLAVVVLIALFLIIRQRHRSKSDQGNV